MPRLKSVSSKPLDRVCTLLGFPAGETHCPKGVPAGMAGIQPHQKFSIHLEHLVYKIRVECFNLVAKLLRCTIRIFSSEVIGII